MDEWRTLLYPLGFLSTLVFAARFMIQWWKSEKAHRSLVTRSFWQLSLLGNGLLLIHSLIQLQYHVCIVQGCNAVIAWRNLNLMQTQRPPTSFHAVVGLLIGVSLTISFAFVLQDWFELHTHPHWFRIPTAPWQSFSSHAVSLFWHLLGSAAYLLFSSRFWIQWWLAEKAHESQLPLIFWWLSLVGALLSFVYFMRIGDSVNLIGPLLGLIPYARNLMLIYKTRTAAESL